MKKIIIILLSLVTFPAAAFAAPAWECEDADWVGQPTLEHGVFQSTRVVQCQFTAPKPIAGLKTIQDFFKSDIENNNAIKIEQGPLQVSFEGLPGESYSVVNHLKDGSDSNTVKQNLFVATSQDKLIYEADSTDVQGEGMSSYLKGLNVRIEIQPTAQPGVYTLKMQNGITLERPWFALALVFEGVAKGKVVDKFNNARDEFLKHFLSKLGEV